MIANRKIFVVLLTWIFCNISVLNCQEIDKPRGPWQLAFKVVSGKWDPAVTGHTSFWALFDSTETYNTESPVSDQRDFTTSSDHYKSELVQQWEDGYISVQAIKLSLFKNNEEKAYVVFDAIGKTKTTWFKCDNILYSSYTDLPDNTLPPECPGKNAMGLPLTMMKLSYFFAYCPDTTGWLVVADADFSFSLCPNYMPADGSEPKPYFKYSTLTTVADLSTELETADSIGIFFQVWDMAFKGVEGIKPSASGLNNLTGLFMLDITENDNSDLTVRNLQHTQSSQIFKSDVINLWDYYFIDTVKFSMLKSGIEEAYVVFDGTNSDKLSWFTDSNILYSSYGSSLDSSSLEICSIEGDSHRNWQIQSLSDDLGCSETEQMGWMLVKEPKNNGTCSWDTSTIKKKPYFLYNTGTSAASPSTFQYADVIAVFVHGWRMVLKVSAGGSLAPKSSIFSLWSDNGGMNENADLGSMATFKSSIIDQWTSFYIRAVKVAAYKDGLEVFNAVFDATGSSNTNWFDCSRLLYTTVSGLTSTTANTNSYTCSLQGDSSTFRFFLGKSPDCGSVSATGMFWVVDADSACSSRNDLPQFLYSNTMGTTISDVTELHLADTFAIFVDMANCYSDTCLNGATCQDLGGNFRCFCTGNYFGETCANLNGTFGEWSTWSECSVTCADGIQNRNRTCIGAEGVGTCAGESLETKNCTLDPCPINGGYTSWSEWSLCSVTCGVGEMTRSRVCSNPTPEYGGADCDGVANETSACSSECPIDGQFTEWTTWTQCSATCGNGDQTRSRSCSNPVPQFGGVDCIGATKETETCNLASCSPESIDGGFNDWSVWTACSVTCGSGQQSRNRTCSNPEPQNGGNDCEGDLEETQSCSSDSCPQEIIDGGFSDWSDWTECSVTCGGGGQTRNRTCSNPEPQNGGNDCVGDSEETQPCSTETCPPDRRRSAPSEIINGAFSDWSVWTECSVTCGGGEQTRSRTCSNPEPQNGGNDCVGDLVETLSCTTDSCPPEIIDGGFSDWSDWTECSVTCGGGEQTRNRTCSNPEPQNGGNDCVGDSGETQPCSTSSCPPEIIDGGFSDWSDWTECSVTCGGGEQTRNRTCSNPEPQNGGNDCVGDLEETQQCNTDSCPPGWRRSATHEIIDGGFSDWSDWTECSVTCGGGEQTRSRTCSNPVPENGGIDCVGDLEETQPCNTDTCPPVDGGFTEWTAWTECSVTCGDGQQTRTRECTNPEPQFGGNDCEGNIEGIMACNLAHCPVNGEFTEWSLWSECSVTCGNGTHIRSRDCSNPEPQYGGEDCVGETEESETCELDPCPVDGYWLSWEDWTLCSASCGSSGTRERTRTCVDPLNGGNPCNGAGEQVEFCNTQECPFDGVWSEWASWGDCNATCEGGVKERTRSCIGPLNGGTECTGISRETDLCNEIPCPIDGHWANWDEWSTCTFTCNTGTRERTRDCIDPQHDGKNCTGAVMQTEFCNTNLCPVDGEWRNWSEWSTCTVPCGGGSRNRSRTCIEPLYGGFDCMGNETDTDNCNEEPCPVDGFWLDWSEWDSCSVSCAEGTRNRSRSCVEPSYGGANCTGESSQSENCNNGNCPIDGFWSDWSEWTKCSQTCGGGYRNKSRECNEPLYGGLMCQGEMSETDTCNVDACPIDGEWLDWSQWSTCSKTCGGGTRVKTRNCTQPKYGGKFCEGESSETDMCNVEPCAVDGYWEEWSNWTECSVSCAGGSRNRTRECVQPKFTGKECTGIDAEEEECNTHDCPVDGIWTTWLQWSECSATCNGGARNRSRTCIGTQNGGKYCAGHDVDIQICALELCPSIDGGWSDWTSWTACSMSCGFSERTRNRTCTNPSPQWGGKYCEGIHIQSDSCMENDCPVDGVWSSWATWSSCLNMTVNDVSSPKCGRGFRYRNRTCDNPAPQFAGTDCSGNLTEIKNCNIPCHVITCSKENPEKCQIVFQNIPGNKGNRAATSTSVVITIMSFMVKLCI